MLVLIQAKGIFQVLHVLILCPGQHISHITDICPGIQVHPEQAFPPSGKPIRPGLVLTKPERIVRLAQTGHTLKAVNRPIVTIQAFFPKAYPYRTGMVLVDHVHARDRKAGIERLHFL